MLVETGAKSRVELEELPAGRADVCLTEISGLLQVHRCANG